MPSTSKRALIGCAGLVASLALLAGCGDSGGGSGGPATTAGGANTFDGTGSEALGYWVLRVTSSTGIYATDHIAPVGLTVGCGLQISGTNLQFFYDNMATSGTNGWTTLTADTASKTYKATGIVTTVGSSAAPSTYYGPREGQQITEDWTLTPLSTGARLTINGSVTSGGTGSGMVTADLIPVAPFPLDTYVDSDWYGYGAKSNNALYTNSTNVCELYDYNYAPGAYGYFYWDAGYQWGEYIYVDQMYREGNVLKGGGFYDGDRETGIATYGIVSITLDNSGRPIGEHIDLTEGYGASAAHSAVDAAHFTNGDALDTMYDPNDHAHYYALTIDSVTSGGLLEGAFGTAGTTLASQVRDRGYRVDFGNWSQVYTGNNTSTSRSGVVYSDGDYHNTPPNYSTYPGNDFDSDATTEERSTVTINYDTSVDRHATGGSIVLQVYNASHVLQSTETMTFTLTY